MSVRVLRRSFLAGLGVAAGGLAIGGFGDAAVADDRKIPKRPIDPSSPKVAALTAAGGAGLRPNVFVHVGADDMVTIVCARSEMGQGVRSSLPVLVADEMGADMAHVRIVQGDGDPKYGDQNTDGSSSVRGVYDDVRRVGAAARVMLVAAAAKRWKVAPDTCTTRDHAVVHAASGKSLRFGALADEAGKQKVPDTAAIVLRPAAELTHVGTDLPLLDGPDIVTGRAVFGADVRVPGMLTAIVARPPVLGGTLVSHDATRTLAIPGVREVVVLPTAKAPFGFAALGGVAVVASDTWSAMRGRAALDVQWDHGANASYDSTTYREQLVAAVGAPGTVAREVGDVEAALARAKDQVEATYYAPHLAHATMEPPVAVAKVDAAGCEVWASTQNPQAARIEVAKALGLDESKVVVHVTLLGGGFGRKSKPDYVVEAALLAKHMGAPVRVQWTREDDLRHDYYHSVSAQRITAGLDDAGRVIAWRQRIAFPTISSTFEDADEPSEGELQQGVLDTPLSIPALRAEGCKAIAHTRIGWLRSVANIYHAFAIQSFIDELATARGVDSLAMQRELIGAPRSWTPADLGIAKLPNYGAPLEQHPVDTARHHRVLDRVTDLCGWSDRMTKGRALGLAVHRSFLTYVAVVVSVVKTPNDRFAVDEAWIVADAGTIVNRERVHSQLEGAVMFGLSLALFGEITMKAGIPEQADFRAHRLLRIAEAPKAVHIDVLASDAPPGGIGEPGVPPVAPALANALFALTGTRVRELPIAKTMRGW